MSLFCYPVSGRISGVALTVLLSACGTLAENLNVPNHSFEIPDTPYISINIQSWQKPAKPEGYNESGGYLWTQLTGIFENTPTNSHDHIDNCDGGQALWLFAVPEAGLFQDYDSMDSNDPEPSHEFNVTYNVGSAYELTVGALVGAIGTAAEMPEGATLEMGLYYRVGTNRVNVAVTVVTNTPTVFSNSTHLVDCRLITPPVQASDPWANKHLGIQLISTISTNLPQVGYWDLDNVRLREIPPSLVVSSPTVTNGHFQFIITSQPGKVLEIFAAGSPSLSTTNWTSLGMITNTTGTTPFVDTSGNFEQRYYRVQQLQ